MSANKLQKSELASSFIKNNLTLFGFEDRQALIMSCKELFDNSMDAVRRRRGVGEEDAKDCVKITVSNEEPGGVIKVEIDDTGCGIQDSGSFLNYFNTDKTSDSNISLFDEDTLREEDETFKESAGRFGVGLSACLLYSVSNVTLI